MKLQQFKSWVNKVMRPRSIRKSVLLSAIPYIKFDYRGAPLEEGGGYVLSGVGAVRYYPSFSDASIYLAIEIGLTAVSEGQEIKTTKLVALDGKDDSVVGEDIRHWNDVVKPFRFGEWSIFRWRQGINVRPERNGMIHIRIYIQMTNESDFQLILGDQSFFVAENNQLKPINSSIHE